MKLSKYFIYCLIIVFCAITYTHDLRTKQRIKTDLIAYCTENNIGKPQEIRILRYMISGEYAKVKVYLGSGGYVLEMFYLKKEGDKYKVVTYGTGLFRNDLTELGIPDKFSKGL